MTREEAIKRLKEYAQYAYGIYHNEQKDEEAFDMAIEALSADTMEIVRCKDCKYAEHREQAERVYCHRERLAISCPPRDNDDFCKYGERSEE